MTNIIISIIKFINSFQNFLIPDALLNIDVITNFNTYVEGFLEICQMINFCVPLPTLFTCLGIVLSIRIVKVVIFVQNWIIRSVLDVIP